MLSKTLSGGKTLLCGHRGACGIAPENTLVSFRKALELGADFIEFDVQLSADGVPIIFHDDTLARTTDKGGRHFPDELTLAQLKALDAGSWFNRQFAGTQIPTLDEVLDEFGGCIGLNIEIKSRPGENPANGIEAKVAEAVASRDLYANTIVSSFDPARLTRLHTLNSRIAIGLLVTGRARDYPRGMTPWLLAERIGAKAFHPPYKIVDAALVAEAHARGLSVNTWTVNDKRTASQMLELGVDMVMGNFIDELKAASGD